MAANVLIVDDSKTMRLMIRRTLEMSGLDYAEVYEAENGIEAFSQLAQHEVALVILDMNMPLMNGLQFLERVHDDARLRNIPVVIASTEGSQTRVRELLKKGARGFLRKPFHPEQLRDVLAPLLGVRPDENVGSARDDSTF